MTQNHHWFEISLFVLCWCCKKQGETYKPLNKCAFTIAAWFRHVETYDRYDWYIYVSVSETCDSQLCVRACVRFFFHISSLVWISKNNIFNQLNSIKSSKSKLTKCLFRWTSTNMHSLYMQLKILKKNKYWKTPIIYVWWCVYVGILYFFSLFRSQLDKKSRMSSIILFI